MNKSGVNNNKIQKNIILSIMVQLISLCVSFVLNLVVPKFIDQYQYAYWQSYVLYVSYVGVLHFGLLDGIMLRYSQYDYYQLDKSTIRSQLNLMLFAIGSLSLITLGMSALFIPGVTKTTIILLAVGIVTKNLFTYTSYSFQMTNRISKYAIAVIIHRLAYGIAVCILLALGINDFKWYCIADLFSDILCVCVAFLFNSEMYFGKAVSFADSIAESRKNISSGLFLLLANWSSMLLLGSAKMIIQLKWDELIFAKVSFSFSVSNLFVTFITAVSVVLFPALKRMDAEKLPALYKKIRQNVTMFLFGVMIFYFPGCYVLKVLLPAYADSLNYLGILLPIIIYTSKVTLLTNNYLKAYRKEKTMLAINAVSILICIAMFVFGAYVLNNLTTVIVCIVIATMINSVLSEIFVMKMIKVYFVRELMAEAIMTILFVLIANYLDNVMGFVAYTAVFVIFLMAKGNLNIKRS